MILQEHTWYNVEDLSSDLESIFQKAQQQNVRGKLGLLMKYENGLIEFEPTPYLKGDLDGARNYYIDKFMLITY